MRGLPREILWRLSQKKGDTGTPLPFLNPSAHINPTKRPVLSEGFHNLRKNRSARSHSGNNFSSAWNSAECTHLRLPRSRTGCFKCSIS